MKTFEPLEPFSPVAKTVREIRLEQKLENWERIGTECLPYLLGLELEQSSEKLRALVESIVAETS